MNRYQKDNRPVIAKQEKIELSERHLKLRVVLLIVFLLLALVSIGFFVGFAINVKAGYQVIDANLKSNNDAIRYTFVYNIEGSFNRRREMKKELVANYEIISDNATYLFDRQDYNEEINVYYINNHPNEILKIDKYLYQTLKKFKDNNNNQLFYGIIYDYYRSLFLSLDDSYAKNVDYYYNDTVNNLFNEVVNYVNNYDMIHIEFYDDYKIKLFISDDYLAFANDYDFNRFIDFGYLKDAILIDYICDILIENRYFNGYVSSGHYFRQLSKKEARVSLYDKDDNKIDKIANLKNNFVSLVSYNSFPFFTYDNYYIYDDGRIVTDFIDNNGKNNYSVNSMIAYTNDYSCLDLLLKSINLFTSDDIDENKINLFKDKIIYVKDKIIYYNDDSLTIDNIETYEKHLLKE